MPALLTLAGTLITMGVIVWYFWVINKEKVPVSVAPFAAVVVAGIVLAALAVAMEPRVLTVALLGLDLAVGGFILWLLTFRKLPDGALIAKAGQPLPPLAATDDTGAPFDLTSLKGRRVMLKFFRGSW
jgi:hypothetical protein